MHILEINMFFILYTAKRAKLTYFVKRYQANCFATDLNSQIKKKRENKTTNIVHDFTVIAPVCIA